MPYIYCILLGTSEIISGTEKQTNSFSNMQLQNAYGYPPSYNYSGGLGYQYNWGQNTKEQMEAYSKLVLASYQNGQQFCSPNIQQYTQQQQQHALGNTLSTSNNVQSTQHETPNSPEEMGNDMTKVDESSAVSDNSSITTTSSEPRTPLPNSTTLPSPGDISSNNQDSPNNSLTAPSSNQCTTSPNENNIQGTINSSQLYSPTNAFGNWQTNNFPYTADNPYAAFYNNPNVAAMYNQSMTMGSHYQPSYFSGGSVQQQPDSTTTSGNMNRGWTQNAAQTQTAAAYPFHPAASAATSSFVSPFSESAAALYNNYASLWNTHPNAGQYLYGNTLHPPQANVNGFVNNLSSMNDKMKQYCDNQQLQQTQPTQIGEASSTQIKSFYNDHVTQSQQDKLQPATTTTMDDQQNMLNDPSSSYSMANNQPLDLELTYRNNPELAEKLRQVSLKKPRVTFSIKQVVELEKEFHSSR